MTDSEHYPTLPRVTESDILKLVLDDIMESETRAMWKRFADTNPVLANEVLRRAAIDARSMIMQGEAYWPTLQALIVDSVTFAVNSMIVALERQREEEAGQMPGLESNKRVRPTDDAGDADPQPSA